MSRSLHAPTRREVLRASISAAAFAGFGTSLSAATARPARPTVCLFSKQLGGRPVDQLPDLLHGLKIHALDLTCRPGGHVLPERVQEDLPRAHALLKKAGVRLLMLTTGVTDAHKDHAEAIFRTAASLDIRFIKLGYYTYSEKTSISDTLREVKVKLRDLAALAGEHRVQIGFHNHSGLNVGSPMWDLHELIDDLPAQQIGSYFDGAHATVEGGHGGWQLGLNLLAPRIVMLAVKDVRWQAPQQGEWKPDWCPLGEGMVQWPRILQRIMKLTFTGPISLHVEYLKSAPPNSEAEKSIAQAIGRDWTALQGLLRGAGLMESE